MKNKFRLVIITLLVTTITLANGNHSVLSLLNNKNETINSILTSPPTGNASQTFCAVATLNSIQVNGTNIKWYATASGGNVLPNTTLLVNNTSYYASQTVSGIESSSRLQVTVTVNPKPVATIPNDYHVCDDNTDGIAVFNLINVVTPQVLGTTLPAANYTVTYYASLVDAQAPANAIVLSSSYSTSSSTVWIRVENSTTGCFDIVTVNLIVDPLPHIFPFYPQFELCETVAPLCVETFDLTTQIPFILNGQLGVEVTFYPSLADATANTNPILTPSAYTNTQPCAQTIGIRLTNSSTGCYAVSTMDLVVNPKPQPIPPAHPYVVCDDNQDGVASFDLNSYSQTILFQTPGVYNITIHLTEADAESNVNPIDLSTPFINLNHPFTEFVWVRTENPITHCFALLQIELDVYPKPSDPVLNLVGNVLYSNATSGNQWYNQNGIIVGATGTSYTLPSSGLYGCQVTSIYGCTSNIVTSNFTLGAESFIESNFSLYPNPTSDYITILIPSRLLNDTINYTISDIAGKIILEGNLKSENTSINTSPFENGVYFILFKNNENQLIKKFIKK